MRKPFTRKQIHEEIRKMFPSCPLPQSHAFYVFAECIGIELTAKFILECGGKRMKIPSGKKTSGHENISALIGAKNTECLKFFHGREEIYIPFENRFMTFFLTAQGISQEEIANKLRIPRSSVQNYLSGRGGCLSPLLKEEA